MIRRPFAILLLLTSAFLGASNHVAARFAFDDGAGLVLALVLRSAMAALIVFCLSMYNKQSFRVAKESRPWVVALGFIVAIQSWFMYSSVAIMPVVVSLLLVNSWPVMYIALSWSLGGPRPRLPLLLSLAVILFGLTLVMNVGSVVVNPDLSTAQWWLGIFYGLSSAVFLAGAIWVTDNKLNTMSGSVRNTFTMVIVSSSMLVIGLFGWLPSNFSLPSSSTGYIGLFLLMVFYGLGSTIMFSLSPKLDMGRNAPVLNFEPVASLILGYFLLGQILTPVQLVGGALVVGGIVVVGLIR